MQQGLVLIDDCIRFRTDVIEDSIAHRPDLVDDSQIKALNLLTDIIAKSTATQRVMLNPNELIIIDNKRLLHGREAFEDTSRHLLRVRLRERPALALTSTRRALLRANPDLKLESHSNCKWLETEYRRYVL